SCFIDASTACLPSSSSAANNGDDRTMFSSTEPPECGAPRIGTVLCYSCGGHHFERWRPSHDGQTLPCRGCAVPSHGGGGAFSMSMSTPRSTDLPRPAGPADASRVASRLAALHAEARTE